MDKYNQHKKIWVYLTNHPEGITPMDAWNKLFITKLSTRIGEMVKLGYKIERFPEQSINEDGELRRYMRYKKAV